jgi:hypothetical protein
MPDLKYLFSCKRNLQQPNPREIKPRNSKGTWHKKKLQAAAALARAQKWG